MIANLHIMHLEGLHSKGRLLNLNDKMHLRAPGVARKSQEESFEEQNISYICIKRK